MAFTLSIGQTAPDFDLPGVDNKRYSLASFRDAKLLVVVFSCNHCPYVVGSEERLKRFYADFAPRGAPADDEVALSVRAFVRGSRAVLVHVPDDVDPEHVNATYRDGVLRISLARHVSAQPKRIAIQ